MAQIISIHSEQDAWNTLSGLINGKIKAGETVFDFGDLDWAKICFNFKGKPFEQTVTASMMKGLVEYQTAFYRAAALILKGDSRISLLTNKEKDELELIFLVEKGSSDIQSEVAEQAGSFISKAIDKMTDKQTMICILVLLVLYFGSGAISNYFEHEIEKTRIESALKDKELENTDRKELYQIIEKVMENDKEKTRLLNKAYEKSESARSVGDYNRDAVNEIIRNSGKAEQITIQNVTLDSKVIKEVTKSTRSSSKDITIKDTFRVIGVDSDDIDSFTVKLERVSDGTTIVATLDDPLVSDRHQNAVKSAEWSKREVMVHLKARQVGEQIKDARITRAYLPRKKRK
jgi:hypothetical protein